MISTPKMPEPVETEVPSVKPGEADQNKKNPLVKPMPDVNTPYLTPASKPFQK